MPCYVESSRVEPFGCAVANFFVVEGMVSAKRADRLGDFPALSVCRLADFDTPPSCAYNFFRLISVLQIMF